MEILSNVIPNALVIPTEAVAFDSGHEYCYVARADSLERRDLTVGESSEDLLEVTAGLIEGEQVVLNPEKVMDVVPVSLVHSGVSKPYGESVDSPTR